MAILHVPLIRFARLLCSGRSGERRAASPVRCLPAKTQTPRIDFLWPPVPGRPLPPLEWLACSFGLRPARHRRPLL